MRTKNLLKATALALALLTNGAATAARAQDSTEKSAERRQRVERQQLEVVVQGPEGEMPPPAPVVTFGRGDNTFVFVSTEMSFDGKVVKGAPYSAQAVTEMVQTLADGNRIVRKNTANVYRDGEGRTRRDQTLGAIGPYSVAGDPPQTFFINDPVAGVNYVLDPRTKTARKLNIFYKTSVKPSAVPAQPKVAGAAPAQAVSKPRVSVNGFGFNTQVAPAAPDAGGHFFYSSSSPGEQKKESLGKQTVEGVEAEGSRVTVTIPAGEIGNEQPINIISERWYSNELQTVVMTRHSDPRHGETIYRLTNINRNEPARTLFEIPTDYTVKETPSFQRPMRRRMPAPPVAPNDLDL
jgi:hypothetical protein